MTSSSDNVNNGPPMSTPSTPPLSVIIPVLHEATDINTLVGHVRALHYPGPKEIVVADAAGDTLAALRPRTAECLDVEGQDVVRVAAPPGRARQMNAGAAHASGDILLFLHADTRLPPDGLVRAAQAMAHTRADGAPRFAAGAFSLRVDSPDPLLRALIRVAALRNRLTRTPYGDQAIFTHAALFRRMGGFAAIPLMEDVEFMRRLRRAGQAICVLDAPAVTSARRWEKEGVVRASLRNIALRALYACGAPPERLARCYRPHTAAPAASSPGGRDPAASSPGGRDPAASSPGGRDPAASSPGGRAPAAPVRPSRRATDCVLFFVKPPVPGAVKTRLAATLGAASAAALYDAFARDMYDTLRGLDATVRVCVAPEHGGGPEQVAAWLGPDAPCHVQNGRDVGERMRHAFDAAFADGFARAICIGSDIPDLPAAIARAGLDALQAGAGGAVLAPAQDGGYFCIGFEAGQFLPETFDALPWSTGQVYALTRARLQRSAAQLVLLPPWRDVDTLDDLRALAARLRAAPASALAAPRTAALLRTLPLDGPRTPSLDGSDPRSL
ncbi:MAG: TIGR04283 family arsenosugar biosynthesis glycosyltransferase [Desulfovibrionaceae bacterium]